WLFRAEVLARMGPYSLDYPAAEDYEFLRRAASRVAIANVPDILLDYRISTGGISVSKRRRQLLDRLKTQLRYIEPLEWRGWAGMAKTLALFAIPRKLLTALKAELRSWRREKEGMPGAGRSRSAPDMMNGRPWG